MPLSKCKCGVVGCGVIALAYIPSIKKYGELVAVCDSVPERAERFKRIYSAKEYYTDFNEMLEKSEIDVVFILTGMGIHAKQVAIAAKHGKHILVQKPLATNMKDLREALEEVKKANVKCLVEPNIQQSPLYLKAKELLEENAIEEILWFRAGLGRDPPTWGSETFFTKEAGGPLFDLGVYEISALTFLLGPAKRVIGLAKISIPEIYIIDDSIITEKLASAKSYSDFFSLISDAPRNKKVNVTAEDNTFTCLEMKNGSLGCIVSNFITPDGLRIGMGDMPAIEIYGTSGALLIGDNYVAIKTNKSGSKYYLKDDWYKISVETRWNYYDASTKHLIECVMNDKTPLPNVMWGAHVSEIMIKSIESARTGKALELTTTF